MTYCKMKDNNNDVFSHFKGSDWLMKYESASVLETRDINKKKFQRENTNK